MRFIGGGQPESAESTSAGVSQSIAHAPAPASSVRRNAAEFRAANSRALIMLELDGLEHRRFIAANASAAADAMSRSCTCEPAGSVQRGRRRHRRRVELRAGMAALSGQRSEHLGLRKYIIEEQQFMQ